MEKLSTIAERLREIGDEMDAAATIGAQNFTLANLADFARRLAECGTDLEETISGISRETNRIIAAIAGLAEILTTPPGT